LTSYFTLFYIILSKSHGLGSLLNYCINRLKNRLLIWIQKVSTISII